MTEAAPQTCGRGLARNAALPAALAAVVGAMADVLDAHMGSIVRSDPAGEREHAAYARLRAAQREVAERLGALAADMEAQHDLPMAEHDMAAMAAQGEPFARLVGAEGELAELLERRAAAHRELLRQMDRA
jgi:hypothetical protein